MFPAARLAISISFAGSLFVIEVIACIGSRRFRPYIFRSDVGRDSFDVDMIYAERLSVDDDRVNAGRERRVDDDRSVASASPSLPLCELDTHRYVTRRFDRQVDDSFNVRSSSQSQS